MLELPLRELQAPTKLAQEHRLPGHEQYAFYLGCDPVLDVIDVGLEIIISTAVNSGRNAQAEVIAEKVGRDILKYNNLQWTWLTAEQWAQICSLFDNFFVTARVWDMAHAEWKTIKMYPGDRSAEIYWIDPVTKIPKNYTNCKVNIIDCGML